MNPRPDSRCRPSEIAADRRGSRFLRSAPFRQLRLVAAAGILLGAAVTHASTAPDTPVVITIGGAAIADEIAAIVVAAGFRAEIFNSTDHAVIAPAEPGACALVGIERREAEGWRRWSNCSLLRSIDNPLTIESGEALDAVWRPRASRRSQVERMDDPLRSAPPTSVAQQPIDHEVEQLLIDTPSVRFFERFKDLPAGEYRLVASFAEQGRPHQVMFAHSPVFLIEN